MTCSSNIEGEIGVAVIARPSTRMTPDRSVLIEFTNSSGNTSGLVNALTGEIAGETRLVAAVTFLKYTALYDAAIFRPIDPVVGTTTLMVLSEDRNSYR